MIAVAFNALPGPLITHRYFPTLPQGFERCGYIVPRIRKPRAAQQFGVLVQTRIGDRECNFLLATMPASTRCRRH